MSFTDYVFWLILAVTITAMNFIKNTKFLLLVFSLLCISNLKIENVFILLLYASVCFVGIRYSIVYRTISICFLLILFAIAKIKFIDSLFVIEALQTSVHILKEVPGISFINFMAITFIVDNFGKKINLTEILIYLSFYPHLICGPIVKYCEISQLIRRIKIVRKNIETGTEWCIFGLFLKIVVADNIIGSSMNNYLEIFSELNILGKILMTVQMSNYMVCDFGGYSLCALGCAKMIGANIVNNFNFPYSSCSFAEFWQRWHISLGLWFKNYVYIPLGGNRVGKIRFFINIMCVMSLSGIWHGGNLCFLLWGIIHGIFLYFSLLRYKYKLEILPNWFEKTLGWFFVYCVVSFLWYPFFLNKNYDGFDGYAALVSNYGNVSINKSDILAIFLVSFCLLIFGYIFTNNHNLQKYWIKSNLYWRGMVLGLCLFMVLKFKLVVSASFVYFQF